MRTLAPLWAILTALSLVGAPVTAQVSDGTTDDATKEVTVVAREAGCPGDKSFCLTFEGEPPSLSQGDEVNLTLRNPEENQGEHNVHVARNESADPDHQDTDDGEAIAETATIEPGATASVTFTVPDAEALYLWCDTTGHEAGGMWTTIELQGDNGTEDNGTFGNDTEDNETRENETTRNDTQENETRENDTARNETSGNDTSENDTDEDRTTREESEPEPLQPTEGGPQDGGPDGRQTPIGWPVLALALVAAAVGLGVARDDR